MSVKCLRIHVPVSDSGQGLHAEEKAIEKPMRRCPGNAVVADTVKSGEKKIQPNVNTADKRGKLWPTQAQQPAIDIAPFPSVGIDFDELDRAGADRNFSAS